LKAAEAFIAKNQDERVLMQVSGIFESHEATHAELVKRLLAAKDAGVRAYGARAAAKLPNALELLATAVRDEHPRVRLEAVVACAHVLKPQAVEVAVQALDKPTDRFIDYALKQVVKSLKPQFVPVLASLTFGGNAKQAAYVKQIASAAAVVEHPGKLVYDALCLNCHQPEGKGLPGIYPSIISSDWLKGDPDRVIKVLLHGLSGPIRVNGEEFKQLAPLPMPPMGLDDQQMADVLSYVRSNFSNKAPAVTPAQVKSVRDATAGRAVFWTQDELAK
jgi:mono/diheme cytochrome c family protein